MSINVVERQKKKMNEKIKKKNGIKKDSTAGTHEEGSKNWRTGKKVARMLA